MGETTCIFFDVLDTLVRDPFPGDVLAFFGASPSQWEAAARPAAWLRFEDGTWAEEAYRKEAFRPGSPFDSAGLKEALRRGYRWVEGMEALLADLNQAQIPLHVLSNYPPWYALIEEALGLSRYLPWSVVSCETGVRKPDPQAFQGPLDRLGLAPEQCLLVDDREENCAAARQVGLEVHRFQGADLLRQALSAWGVL